MYFAVLENSISIKKKNRNKVEDTYYSLGLPQQATLIKSADHQDLSVVWPTI